ncbi:MAG: efflux RND transporter periplasmic adaptor subunit [Candidatus Omnitrophica bacterium]|nr:efflux RND transporter periplasmic adaptor subunit [Candidatus Omnitrophota bacterium]
MEEREGTKPAEGGQPQENHRPGRPPSFPKFDELIKPLVAIAKASAARLRPLETALLEHLKKLGGILVSFWSAAKVRVPFLEKIKLPPAVQELIKKIPIGSPDEKKKLIRWGVTVILFVLIAMLFSRLCCVPKEKKAPETAQTQAPDVMPITVFKVARYNFEDSLNALGSIKGAVEFKLSFEIPGVISSINYREGELYEEGALLISLKQDDALLRLKSAQSKLNKAETTSKLAKQKVDEHKKLFAIGAIPESTLEKAELELEAAEFDAEGARLEVKANESILEKSNLYAPSAGTIGELHVEEGEAVTPNTLIGSHVMTEYVEAEFGVVERDLKKLALGQKAKVYVDAYPDKTFDGAIDNIAPVVAGTSRTASVRVRIDNPERLLMPGMFARIKVLIFAKRNTLVLPTEAIVGSGEEKSVFIADEKTNTVSQRPIVVGYTRSDYSQIDEGIQEGDLVVVTAVDRMKEGAKIKILEKQEAEL